MEEKKLFEIKDSDYIPDFMFSGKNQIEKRNLFEKMDRMDIGDVIFIVTPDIPKGDREYTRMKNLYYNCYNAVTRNLEPKAFKKVVRDYKLYIKRVN